jgi:PhnO protein
MEENVVIRPAAPEDAAVLFDFVCELEEEVFDFEVFRRIYFHNIQQPDHIYLVAVNPTETIGYISCHGQWLLHHAGKVFEIQELFVKSSYRGRKIGEQLVQSLRERLAATDCILLEVTTNRIRVDTSRFYEKCGFINTHFKFTMKT